MEGVCVKRAEDVQSGHKRMGGYVVARMTEMMCMGMHRFRPMLVGIRDGRNPSCLARAKPIRSG